MKKLYTSVHANANHTPAMDNSSRFTKNQNIMKSISTLFGRTLALRTMMTLILLFGLVNFGWGQISFVTSGSSSGAILSLPSGWQTGDIAIVYAFRNNSTTAPSLATGFTDIDARSQSGGTTNVSARISYRLLQSDDGSATFTFTNATETEVMILRGIDPDNPILQFAGNGNDNTTINYAALSNTTLSSSWIVGFGAHRNATDVYTRTVTGMTIRSVSSVTKMGMHSMTGVTSFTTRNWLPVNSNSRWITYVTEVKAAPAPGETVTQIFNYTGSNQTFTVPNCVTSITVAAWGGGGAGGGVDGLTKAGGGGEGGSFVRGTINVSPGDQYNVVVGQGGTGQIAADGTSGSASYFSRSGTTYFNAIGGVYGYEGNIFGIGGAATNTGNIASGTSISNYYGGNGGTATNASFATSGGGGGSAGAGGNGGNGGAPTAGTAGAAGSPADPGVAGAVGRSSVNDGNGYDASFPGGGGGGARNANNNTDYRGGNGGNGQIKITYTLPNNPSITLGSNPSVCYGATSADLTYSATNGCPDIYSIDFASGISDVPETNLPASPIVINTTSVAAGTYTGTLTVKNNVYGFVSQTYPISVTVDANSWVGTTTSTDWNTATNWSCGSIPAPGQDVIFATNPANDLILDQDRTIGNLVNNSTRALVIPTGRTLTIGSTATVNNEDRILIKSNVGEANGALIFSQPNLNTAVKATVEYDSKSYKPSTNIYSYVWQYIGTPVNEATPTSVFGANNVNVSGSKYGSAESVLIRKYDESKNEANDYGDKWIEGTPVDVAMTPFAGYEVVQPSTVKPEKDDLISPYLFKGTLVTENKDVTLTTTPTAPYAGTFTLANPYAAPIFFDKMEDTDFGNLERIIYIYNTGSRNDWIVNSGETQLGELPGTYTSIPLYAASTIEMTQIPSMQGFLVATPSIETGSSTFKFRYATVIRPSGNTDYEPMRVQSADAASDAKGKPVQKIKPLITMDVIGAASSDRLYLITADKTTKAYNDGWDGYKFISPNVAQLYAIDSDGNPLQVNTDSDLNETYIGFRSGGESSYRLRFKFSNMDGVYSNLYLNDLATGTTHALTDGTILNFSTVAGSAEKRFKIFANAAKGNSGNTNSKFLKISTASNLIVLDNSMDESGVLKVYDLLGTTVYEAAFVPGSNNFTLNMKKGSYIIEAKTASEKSVVKSILK